MADAPSLPHVDPDASLVTPMGTLPRPGVPIAEDHDAVEQARAEALRLAAQTPPIPVGMAPRQESFQSALNTLRQDLLTELSRVAGPATLGGPSAASAGHHSVPSRESRGSRRRRRRHYSSSSSGSSSDSGGSSRRGRSAAPEPEYPVLICADDRFAAVLDYRTYRLADRRSRYKPSDARRVGKMAQAMAHSFGGHPRFSGKEPLAVFTFLRKFVAACNATGVHEGMAVYLLPHFLSGDAEQRYSAVMPGSITDPDGQAVTAFPEAVNWLLGTYAEPHTLANAQARFSQAMLERNESVESFAGRLRGLAVQCGNIYKEGTLRQHFIQGLPAYIRPDAYVYNTPKRTYQQLVTYCAGKHQAAREMSRLQAPRAPPLGPLRRPSATVAHEHPVDVLEAPNSENPAVVQTSPSGVPRFVAPRFLPPREGPPIRRTLCFLCYQPDHRAQDCPLLTDTQRKAIREAREAFLLSTAKGAPKAGAGKDQDAVDHLRRTRAAMVYSLTESLGLTEEVAAGADVPGNV